MQVMELLPAFRSLRTIESEREAAVLFSQRAVEEQVDRAIQSSRRTEMGFLKIVLDFPEDSDRLEWVTKLAWIAKEVEDQTGVHFILD